MPAPEDVLDRYCAACEKWGVGRVIRATGDNPLTSALLANSIIALHGHAHADLSHYLGCPWGTGVEVIEAEALFTARHRATQLDEREHITTWMYRNPQALTILEPRAPDEWCFPDGRVTVDTEDDYRSVTRIFKELYQDGPVDVDRLVPWLKKHPGLSTPKPGKKGRVHG